jgi:hypothetical protein
VIKGKVRAANSNSSKMFSASVGVQALGVGGGVRLGPLNLGQVLVLLMLAAPL